MRDVEAEEDKHYPRCPTSWGRSLLPFFENRKKCPGVLFVCIYGLNSHLKCSFKSILERKHQNYSLRRPSFKCHT